MADERPELPKGHLAPPKPPKPNILRACWMRGVLAYKLFDHQKILYHSLKAALKKEDCLKYTVNCSRRFGKTTVAAIVAIEYCLSHPDAHVWLTAPTVKSLQTLVIPIVKQILKDCPDDLAPKYNGQYTKFNFFSNGSVMHLVGTDKKHFESLRGQRSDLNIIDEAGFCSDLDYMLNSIMIPQTLTTGGKTILVSTPPKSPSHDFFEIAKSCEMDGNYSCFTIDDNTSITDKIKELYIKEAGGRESTTFRREYMCEFVTDSESAIIPEWLKDKYTQTKKPHGDPLDGYWHRYVSMDLGVRDMTAMIFGYYNFSEAKLYIESEAHIKGASMTTAKIHALIKQKETELWQKRKVYRRISDNNNLLLLQDLQAMHGTDFIPTGKDSLEAMVNEVRLFVQAGRLRVHHSCKFLLGCLEYAIWSDRLNGSRNRVFSHNKTYGHWDHLSALIYLIRNLDIHTNPVPALLGVSPADSYVRKGWTDQPYDGSSASGMRRIMGLEDDK